MQVHNSSNKPPTEPQLTALHHLGSITPVSEHYTTSELVQYPAQWCNTN